MKILIYLGHPAQYHFFKYIIKNMAAEGFNFIVLLKKKDILEQLLINDNLEYINILPEGRESTKSGLFIGLVKREQRLFNIVKSYKPSLMLGSDPSIAHIGKVTGIPALTILEDDYNIIPYLSITTYPFTKNIIAPTSCNCGPWNYKKISYSGYMKLAYLHPNYFQPRLFSSNEYFLIRCSALDAHHDSGIAGLDHTTLFRIVDLLKKKGQIKILSEKPLEKSLRPYQFNIVPAEIHNYLYNSRLLISDSQSMTMEAAMLGVPSIRYSSFAGRIGVLEELEHNYKLTNGIKPENSNDLFRRIDEILETPDLRSEYEIRRKIMLSDKIDVTQFFSWLIAEYPESIHKILISPEVQFNFK